ncbi:MAG: histidine kinase dimerization/phospho-acceptor domain-containing protein [Acidimicrobiales bacterium]
MANCGEVLSQERLLEHVWDENTDPFTNTVRVTVGTLRRKLTRHRPRAADRDRDRRGPTGCADPLGAAGSRWLSPSAPNPAADRSTTAAPPDEPMSFPARRALQLADRLPDWLWLHPLPAHRPLLAAAVRAAAFMVAGLYAVLATRLHDETSTAPTRSPPSSRCPEVVLTLTEVRARYRSVEALANERALSLLRIALGPRPAVRRQPRHRVAGRRACSDRSGASPKSRDIQATDLSRRIAAGPARRAKQLADTFDAMLTRLDDAFASRQRFIQEASHELRNPLAVMRTNIKVAWPIPTPTPPSPARGRDSPARSAQRMSRLVDDLLVYARLGAPARARASHSARWSPTRSRSSGRSPRSEASSS